MTVSGPVAALTSFLERKPPALRGRDHFPQLLQLTCPHTAPPEPAAPPPHAHEAGLSPCGRHAPRCERSSPDLCSLTASPLFKPGECEGVAWPRQPESWSTIPSPSLLFAFVTVRVAHRRCPFR